MSKEKIAIFVALLVLGAFLGVAFNVYKNPARTQSPEKKSKQQTVGNKVSTADASNEELQVNQSTKWNLTAGKIVFPPPTASPETLNEFRAKLQSQAVPSKILNLGAQCKPSLAVWAVTKGQLVTIKNTDSVTHRLRNDAQKFDITIPPNQEKQWVVAGDKSEFGYRCDRNLGVVGMIVVQE